MKKKYLIATLAAVAFLSFGCEYNGKVTGGGSMDGINGGKANFGFNASQCLDKDDNFVVKGNLNYHDKGVGVKLKGDVTNAGLCAVDGDVFDGGSQCNTADGIGACFGGEHEVQFNYDSKNPAVPGSGTGVACLSDGGEGVNVGGGTFGADSVYVQINSGPYAGYANFQVGINGNVQDHACPGEKE